MNIEKIKILIAQGEITSAIDLLKTQGGQQNWENDILLIAARNNHLLAERTKGITRRNDLIATQNQIIFDLLQLLDKINKDTPSLVGDPLNKKLSNLEKEEKKSLLNNRAFSFKEKTLLGYIFVSNDDLLIGCYPCNAPKIAVGRQKDNTIVLPENSYPPATSRYHGVLFFEYPKIHYEDKSSNGSFINGKKIIREKVTVHWEDEIRMGPFLIYLTKDISNFPDFFQIPTE